MLHPGNHGEDYLLYDPVKMPFASTFLWNEVMMLHATCRGYVTVQFMQPEPSKYSYPPILQAKTFLLPEPSYYAHHPGRFVYLKDEDTGAVYSAPYEPVRAKPDTFTFTAGKKSITWQAAFNGIEITMRLTLPRRDAAELWTVAVENKSGRTRRLSVYPYFTIGYMSWMNQGAVYREDLQAVVASCITPYQKYEDYDTVKTYKDKTFLWAESAPLSWEANQQRFEGDGGLWWPDGVTAERLGRGEARYETPLAALQYRVELVAGERKDWKFVFGAAKDDAEIQDKINTYSQNGFAEARADYDAYYAQSTPALQMNTPDAGLDNYVNHWLPRQAYFHGATNRLATDPQTRNYLQDAMGMTYVKPDEARKAFLFALGQQKRSGAMPDGILLYPGAELKYINQVPHSDHCVWVPVCMLAYLSETADYALLEEQVSFADRDDMETVAAHVDLAVDWLLSDRDERGLNYIRQGDWCDPMNAVGYRGAGVSAWLTMATAYAAKVWAEICTLAGRHAQAQHYQEAAAAVNEQINRHLWDGDWYARGITDDGVPFGIQTDGEGRIYLNPQSWSLLCGAADAEKRASLMHAVQEQLETPYGVELLAPSYTKMREDVGRLTQKYPGVTENGSVYNHAAAFYIFALYEAGEYDHAYQLLRKMLPADTEEDYLRRGQMPVFIPNYYRGAYRQMPEHAGRSSQLFCTGTISWVYRCVVEKLFGLRGTLDGLEIKPAIPSHWDSASVTREFRGMTVHVHIRREAGVTKPTVLCGEQELPDGVLKTMPGSESNVTVLLPL